MAVDPTWTVWCDIGDAEDRRCSHWCEATGMSKSEAWANAKTHGWVKKGGRIACPGCVASLVPSRG